MNQKIRTAVVVAMVSVSMLLTGCVSTQSGSEQQASIRVAPVSPDYKLEITLAKLNEILASVELTPEQRARFHYDRGVIYDRVGLRILSRIDFHQALKLQPNLADAYNFLGIYYTQESEFESAYEAFDAVLELSPDYDYAFLNRGISLYYGERMELAVSDMSTFYEREPSDGYRALWLYLVEREIDEQNAQAQLATNREKLQSDAWSTALVDYYLGQKSKEDVFSLAKEGLKHPNEYAERLCEAYFYMAKIAQKQGDNVLAANYFRLALATNIYDFVEHRFARLELARTNEALKLAIN
ncbi:Tetratricopeptide TPR_2 repeat protein [Shewanella halifaxensis HAW-EB4]|uniref:Lipoprotein NlpI n=1 Tax=Shewanella halifaxensis (strain HAW-EB4) TaxID=458817 RepID=B0TQ96_SHEHH|nr:lipoprotein NlpI [Shewanella halifaxensis]ABZ77688.1 Tetratricopeptide TPR_2 repeat protein [Shewanella halifaxensis HAW-EB4]